MAILRKRSGKSIRDVADDAGVSRSVVERAEKKDAPFPKGGSVMAILEHAYDLKPTDALHRKAVDLWVSDKTHDTLTPKHESKADSIELRLRRLSYPQMQVIERLLNHPKAFRPVSSFLDGLLSKGE